MAVSGISAASNVQASSTQSSQAIGRHKHGGHHAKSISDVDAQSSSVANNPAGKVGSKVNITA